MATDPMLAGLPEIPAVQFTYDNSMKALLIPCPYTTNGDTGALEKVRYYPENDWKPTGHTLSPPMRGETYGYRWVGIMFERPDGERAWTHFPADLED